MSVVTLFGLNHKKREQYDISM